MLNNKERAEFRKQNHRIKYATRQRWEEARYLTKDKRGKRGIEDRFIFAKLFPDVKPTRRDTYLIHLIERAINKNEVPERKLKAKQMTRAIDSFDFTNALPENEDDFLLSSFGAHTQDTPRRTVHRAHKALYDNGVLKTLYKLKCYGRKRKKGKALEAFAEALNNLPLAAKKVVGSRIMVWAQTFKHNKRGYFWLSVKQTAKNTAFSVSTIWRRIKEFGGEVQDITDYNNLFDGRAIAVQTTPI